MLNCSLHHVQCDKHERPVLFRMHEHPYDELTYFISGSGSTQIGEAVYPYHRGCFAFYRAGTVHNEDNREPCRVIWSHFSYCVENVSLREGVFEDTDGELYALICKLRSAFLTQDSRKSALIEAYLAEVVITAAQLQDLANEPRLSINWQQIADYIDENTNTDIDFSALAATYHYSYDRFRHLFRERFGFAPHAYLLHCRIEHAKRLLEISTATITDIAFNCGFNSSSQFVNAFKQETGITPRRYRKNKTTEMGAVLSGEYENTAKCEHRI